MRKEVSDSRGFGILEMLLIIMLFALVAGAGFYIYHRDHKTASVTTSSFSNSSSSGQTSNNSNAPTPTPTPDPYAGWKTYCDNIHHYCFKYPISGWAIDTSSPEQTSVLNSDKSIEI